VAAKKSSGEAKETLEVIDVAQLLVRSSAIPPAGAAGPTAPTGPPPGGGGRTG
jgi:hypothetical protein